MSNELLESDRKRAFIKALTYRVFGTTLSALIAWGISHDVRISLGVFTFDGFGKIALYYLHERVWNYIPFGHREKTLLENINEQHSQPGQPDLA